MRRLTPPADDDDEWVGRVVELLRRMSALCDEYELHEVMSALSLLTAVACAVGRADEGLDEARWAWFQRATEDVPVSEVVRALVGLRVQ